MFFRPVRPLRFIVCCLRNAINLKHKKVSFYRHDIYEGQKLHEWTIRNEHFSIECQFDTSFDENQYDSFDNNKTNDSEKKV